MQVMHSVFLHLRLSAKNISVIVAATAAMINPSAMFFLRSELLTYLIRSSMFFLQSKLLTSLIGSSMFSWGLWLVIHYIGSSSDLKHMTLFWWLILFCIDLLFICNLGSVIFKKYTNAYGKDSQYASAIDIIWLYCWLFCRLYGRLFCRLFCRLFFQ